jgi:hypothetical protein
MELSARPVSAQADGGLACGGIPCTAPTIWSIVASVCRGVRTSTTGIGRLLCTMPHRRHGAARYR